MRLLDYECQTTFWQDFTIADKFGLDAVRDTYNRARAEWGDDRIYGRNIFLIISTIVLGIGHIGIHLNHKKELE